MENEQRNLLHMTTADQFLITPWPCPEVGENQKLILDWMNTRLQQLRFYSNSSRQKLKAPMRLPACGQKSFYISSCECECRLNKWEIMSLKVLCVCVLELSEELFNCYYVSENIPRYVVLKCKLQKILALRNANQLYHILNKIGTKPSLYWLSN